MRNAQVSGRPAAPRATASKPFGQPKQSAGLSAATKAQNRRSSFVARAGNAGNKGM